MPNFRAHTVIGLVAVGGLAYVALHEFQFDGDFVLSASASFAAATLMLSPDLDLKHSAPTKNWWLLRWIWRPYQMLFRHRGMSHSILVSTMTRLLYLMIMVISMTLLVSFAIEQCSFFENSISWNEFDTNASIARLHHFAPNLVPVFVGIWLSDVCHILTDRIASALKILFAV